MHTIVRTEDLQAEDKIRISSDRSSPFVGTKYHTIVKVNDTHIWYINGYGSGTEAKLPRSSFNTDPGEYWEKLVTEVKYDPEQMLSDEDDL